MAYQVDAGFSRIITWKSIKENPPAKLNISPLAVTTQVNRRGRLILDLSFLVHRSSQKECQKLGEIIQASVNDSTVPLAPLWPVKCLARRVVSIHAAGMPDSTPLSYVSPGTHVVADHILKAGRAAAMQTCLVLYAG
eukprot:scaffold127175_cov52-Attheya_sp.AAC.1